jgi:two-component system, cell cycle sensor histidine kinase and response regulator CckA
MADHVIEARHERAERQRQRRLAALRIAAVNGVLFVVGAAGAYVALLSPAGALIALIAAIVVTALGILSVSFIVLTARSQAKALPRDVLDAVVEGPVGIFHCNDRGDVTFINNCLSSWLEAERADDFARDLLQRALRNGVGESRLEVRTATGRLARLTANIMEIEGGGQLGLVWRRHPFPTAGLTAAPATLARSFVRLLDATPLGVAVVDSTGRLDTMNPALRELLGVPAGDGRYLADFVAVEDRWRLIRNLADAAQSGTQHGPIDVGLAGSSERSLTFMMTPLKQPGSAVRGILLHAIDATQRRHLEQQFEQSQRLQAVGQLAGGVAHDFNNILTAITGFCDLLLRRHPPGDPSAGEIMHIKRDAERAAGLVRQLLTFSRRQTPRPQLLSPARVVSELLYFLRQLIGEDIELQVQEGDDLGAIRADQGQLEQIITNLVVNARDAMPQGGRIVIRTTAVDLGEARPTAHGMAPAGPYVCVEVLDEGTGIAPEHADKIFEPFFTTKEVGEGTGLGLATVYGVLQQNDGFIEVDSAPGAGSVFRVFFPRLEGYIWQEAPASPAPVPHDAQEPEGGGEGTVLLVEDEDTVRAFAAKALRASGYRVMEAASPAAALTLLSGYEGPLDLMVSDVVMPGMSGPQFVEAVTRSRGPTKVIYISGYAEDAANAEAIDSADFLAKPFDLHQLTDKVRASLAGPSPTG